LVGDLGGTQHLDQLAVDVTRLYQAPDLTTNPDAPDICSISSRSAP
jgi:hypothetical protein